MLSDLNRVKNMNMDAPPAVSNVKRRDNNEESRNRLSLLGKST